MPNDKAHIKLVLRRLAKAYKRPVWKCWGKAVSVLVETILSQNTSAANSSAGYRQLRRSLPTWERVAAAPVERIERCIRVSGLSKIKAPRIRQILRQIRQEQGKIALDFLADLPVEEARAYLLRFDGIGPKTVDCVLLFSLGMAVFPVDTHIHRIARRLGWVGPKVSAIACQESLSPQIAPIDRYAMHILLIHHGREVCRARNPRCSWCAVEELCLSRLSNADSNIAKCE